MTPFGFFVVKGAGPVLPGYWERLVPGSVLAGSQGVFPLVPGECHMPFLR